jgi:hypothetical protein
VDVVDLASIGDPQHGRTKGDNFHFGNLSSRSRELNVSPFCIPCDVGQPWTSTWYDGPISQNVDRSLFQILSQPTNGTLVDNHDGSVTVTAEATGPGSFTFGYGPDVPASGTLVLNQDPATHQQDGSFTYTPGANATGWVYFTYEVQSSDGATSPPVTAAIM